MVQSDLVCTASSELTHWIQGSSFLICRLPYKFGSHGKPIAWQVQLSDCTLTKSGPDCICDESSRARGSTRSIPRGNFLHRRDIWSAVHCVQRIDGRTWMPPGRVLCQHVASLPETGRPSHGHKCQSRAYRRDLRRVLRVVF
jgi:hypothetical protein